MAISSIPDRYARLVIIPIAHIDALLIQSIGGLAVDFRGRDVLIAVRPALRQLTAGIGAAIEQLGGSLTARLTGQPHVSAQVDESLHNTLDHEQALLRMVRKGDTAALKEWINHAPPSEGAWMWTLPFPTATPIFSSVSGCPLPEIF